jgi:NTP pyrophosphatase (non-canonical NTP hydrolase)
VDLAELQRKVDVSIRSFGGYWVSFELLARLTEELVESRPRPATSAGDAGRGPSPRILFEEVGDLLFTLAAFANLEKIDLDRAVERVIEKYRERDLKDWEARARGDERPNPPDGELADVAEAGWGRDGLAAARWNGWWRPPLLIVGGGGWFAYKTFGPGGSRSLFGKAATSAGKNGVEAAGATGNRLERCGGGRDWAGTAATATPRCIRRRGSGGEPGGQPARSPGEAWKLRLSKQRPGWGWGAGESAPGRAGPEGAGVRWWRRRAGRSSVASCRWPEAPTPIALPKHDFPVRGASCALGRSAWPRMT